MRLSVKAGLGADVVTGTDVGVVSSLKPDGGSASVPVEQAAIIRAPAIDVVAHLPSAFVDCSLPIDLSVEDRDLRTPYTGAGRWFDGAAEGAACTS